jgi:HAD superfamily hydrolase (TIGR01509 family)
MIAASVQAVIFDMDGLMLDSERMATDAWTRAVASLGFRLTEELNLQLIGRNARDSDAILRAALGDDFPVDAVRHTARRFFRDLTQERGIPVKPGLEPLLDFLGARAVQMAVATSTPREACVRHLQRAHLLERFAVLVCGDEVATGKPAPDIFLTAARLLGTRPETCVVLEDSFAGIRAAHAAGMIPIMVPDLLPPDADIRALAYRVVPNLDQARDVIAALLPAPD